MTNDPHQEISPSLLRQLSLQADWVDITFMWVRDRQNDKPTRQLAISVKGYDGPFNHYTSAEDYDARKGKEEGVIFASDLGNDAKSIIVPVMQKDLIYSKTCIFDTNMYQRGNYTENEKETLRSVINVVKSLHKEEKEGHILLMNANADLTRRGMSHGFSLDCCSGNIRSLRRFLKI